MAWVRIFYMLNFKLIKVKFYFVLHFYKVPKLPLMHILLYFIFCIMIVLVNLHFHLQIKLISPNYLLPLLGLSWYILSWSFEFSIKAHSLLFSPLHKRISQLSLPLPHSDCNFLILFIISSLISDIFRSFLRCGQSIQEIANLYRKDNGTV